MHHIGGYLLTSIGSIMISYLVLSKMFRKENELPIGTIVMWNGIIDDIPGGWVICDGSNGTPNTINRFIMGHNVPGIVIDKCIDATTTNNGKHKHNLEKNTGGYIDSLHSISNNSNEKIVYVDMKETDNHNHQINSIQRLNPDSVTGVFIMKK